MDKRIDNFNRSNSKMQKIRNDIDDAIKFSKKYSDFKFVLIAKGYEIYDTGKYFTVKSPYFSRKVRLDRTFGDNYSSGCIKERIYYKQKEDLPVANLKKKYYKKTYNRYSQIKKDYEKEIEVKNKITELIKEDKKKKMRCR
jgi:hypothetical protein